MAPNDSRERSPGEGAPEEEVARRPTRRVLPNETAATGYDTYEYRDNCTPAEGTTDLVGRTASLSLNPNLGTCDSGNYGYSNGGGGTYGGAGDTYDSVRTCGRTYSTDQITPRNYGDNGYPAPSGGHPQYAQDTQPASQSRHRAGGGGSSSRSGSTQDSRHRSKQHGKHKSSRTSGSGSSSSSTRPQSTSFSGSSSQSRDGDRGQHRNRESNRTQGKPTSRSSAPSGHYPPNSHRSYRLPQQQQLYYDSPPMSAIRHVVAPAQQEPLASNRSEPGRNPRAGYDQQAYNARGVAYYQESNYAGPAYEYTAGATDDYTVPNNRQASELSSVYGQEAIDRIAENEPQVQHRSSLPAGSAYTATGHETTLENQPNRASSASRQPARDPRYGMFPSKEFCVGRVLKCEFPEMQGGNSNDHDDFTLVSRAGRKFFVKDRRFIIISGGCGYSTCVAILTYGYQGCKKHGVEPGDHGIVYTTPESPGELPGERPLGFSPIKMESTEGGLDKESRVNYAKHFNIEHNARVKFVGEIHPNHVRGFLQSVQAAFVESQNRAIVRGSR